VSRQLDRTKFLRLGAGLGAALISESLCRPIQSQGATAVPARLTEMEALQYQRRLFDGMIGHDLPHLAALLDEKLIYIHINGVTQNSRSEFLAWVGTGPKFKTFELIDPKVFIYDDAFALTGRVESASLAEVKPAVGASRYQDTLLHLILSAVWARKPAGWQLVLLQYTQIPDPK
jgi:hypothetical protein